MADSGMLTIADIKWLIVLGCEKVSAGCKLCWALTEAFRYACNGSSLYKSLLRTLPNSNLDWSGQFVYMRDRLEEPKKYRGANIWIAPSSDLFHPAIPLEVLAEILGVVATTPENTFLYLTKRMERLHRLMRSGILKEAVEEAIHKKIPVWPLPNLWEGTSVENEKAADRIDLLLDMPTNFPIISVQPFLSGFDVEKHLGSASRRNRVRFAVMGGEAGPGCRPFDRHEFTDTRHRLRKQGLRVLTQCYPI